MEYRLHQEGYAHIRFDQFHIRLYDVWCAALGLSGRCGRIQNRLVCRVGDSASVIVLVVRSRRAVHSQPTEPWPAGCDARGRRTDTPVAPYSVERAVGVCAIAAAVSGGIDMYRRRVCRCGGANEKSILSACHVLTKVAAAIDLRYPTGSGTRRLNRSPG